MQRHSFSKMSKTRKQNKETNGRREDCDEKKNSDWQDSDEEVENDGIVPRRYVQGRVVINAMKYSTDFPSDTRYFYFDKWDEALAWKARLRTVNSSYRRVYKGKTNRRWGNGRVKRELLQWLDKYLLPFVIDFKADSVPPDMREVTTQIQEDYELDKIEWPKWTAEQLDVEAMLRKFN